MTDNGGRTVAVAVGGGRRVEVPTLDAHVRPPFAHFVDNAPGEER